MDKDKMNIVIMGAQGSGKGTQSRLIAKEYGLEYFETGSMLRKISKENTDLGRTIDDLINKRGQFVPWDVFEEILDLEASRLPKNRGIIFDGTPRRMEEVRFWNKKLPELNKKFDFIFYIKLSKEESLRRIASRLICENNHPLILGEDVKSQDEPCPACGAKVKRRKDDSEEKVLRRLEWNEEILSPVVEYYRQEGTLVEIDGSKDIEEVFEEIKNYIDKSCLYEE